MAERPKGPGKASRIDRTVIRVKAFAVVLDEDGAHHAVARMSTPEHPAFHRPLGGSIELGEHSSVAVVREIAEELEATLVDPELLGVLENVFTIDGETGHEVVFVYGGRLAERDVVPAGGRAFLDVDEPGWVEWRRTSGESDLPLFPEGLQSLIDDWLRRR
jgi:ADP-ribose pyrophosphatase YjhB (NUDIX family)